MKDQTYENNSLYVKTRLEQQENMNHIARSLDKGTASFMARVSQTVGVIMDGTERGIGRGVCAFLSDNNTCVDLRHDDKRMYICTKEFLKCTDALLDILYMCILYILGKYDEETQLRIIAKVTYYLNYCKDNPSLLMCYDLNLDTEEIERILKDLQDPTKRDDTLEHLIGESIYPVMDKARKAVMGLAANLATDMVAKGILAYAVAKFIAGSVGFGMAIRTKLNNAAFLAFNAAYYYGYFGKAAATAERLEYCNPELYRLLYMNNLEMFLFLFKDYLPIEIFIGDYGADAGENAIRFFKGIIK